jgi:hypothetical protein
MAVSAKVLPKICALDGLIGVGKSTFVRKILPEGRKVVDPLLGTFYYTDKIMVAEEPLHWYNRQAEFDLLRYHPRYLNVMQVKVMSDSYNHFVAMVELAREKRVELLITERHFQTNFETWGRLLIEREPLMETFLVSELGIMRELFRRRFGMPALHGVVLLDPPSLQWCAHNIRRRGRPFEVSQLEHGKEGFQYPLNNTLSVALRQLPSRLPGIPFQVVHVYDHYVVPRVALDQFFSQL